MTFGLSLASSLLSQVAIKGSNILIAIMLLVFMIVASILFDVIGISVASCNPLSLYALNTDRKTEQILKFILKNSEKVNNLCADVIGDICGVLSGACGASIVATIANLLGIGVFVPTIIVSAIIASATVGGKAFFKKSAVDNNTQIVLFLASVLKKIIIFAKKEKM